MSGITVSRRGERIVAVKEAPIDSSRAQTLAGEAETLRRISHPSVVEYVEHQTEPTVQLVTMFAGTDTWERRPPHGLDAVRALAALCSIVADLHDAEISHGSLTASHIITGSDTRPVLCGFGRSTALSGSSSPEDLTALAELLVEMTTDLDDQQRSHIAAISTDLRRGSISARTATSRLDALLAEDGAPPPGRRVTRRVIALVAAATIGMSAMSLLTAGDDPSPRSRTSVSAASTTTAGAIGLGPSAAPPAPAAPLVPPTALAPPAPGAPTLINDGRQYALGQPGDVAIVGDWNCDGNTTPALLRPTTGEIAIFGEWPAPKSGVVAQHIVVVEGAHSLEVDEHDVCVSLRARTDTGSVLVPLEET